MRKQTIQDIEKALPQNEVYLSLEPAGRLSLSKALAVLSALMWSECCTSGHMQAAGGFEMVFYTVSLLYRSEGDINVTYIYILHYNITFL